MKQGATHQTVLGQREEFSAIEISATPEEVYSLVSTASGFGQWWATDITQPGPTVDLGFFHRATVYRLRLPSERPRQHADWVCESGNE